MSISPQSAPDLHKAPRPVGLIREAATTEAIALAAVVADLCESHLDRVRILKAQGRRTLREDVGTILADLLRADFKGRASSAAMGHATRAWEATIVGRERFSARVMAMRKAGLLQTKIGTRWGDSWEDGPTTFTGSPTLLWPTERLRDLAAEHGVGAAGAARDWRISPTAERQVIKLRPVDLVRIGALEEPNRTASRIGQRKRVSAVLPESQEETLEVMRAAVAALNAHVASADIRGCLAPAFRRTFKHALTFGGRLNAVGADRYQIASKEERAAITISGEPVAEVDIHASQLCILLALTGTRSLPPGDLYACGGLPRDPVKDCVVQTIGAGRFLRRWSDRTPAASKAIPLRVVQNALRASYPALGDLPAAVPPAILSGVPKASIDWAAGQYLVFLESEIVGDALAYLMARGVIGLPVHDSILVPRSAVGLAQAGLGEASTRRLGLPLRTKVSGS